MSSDWASVGPSGVQSLLPPEARPLTFFQSARAFWTAAAGNRVARRRMLEELVVGAAITLLVACPGRRERRLLRERRGYGRCELLRLECRTGGHCSAAALDEPAGDDCRHGEQGDADGCEPTACASLMHVRPPSEDCPWAIWARGPIRIEARLEARHDLRVDAASRVLCRFDQSSSKLLGHAEQKAISLP